MRITFLSPPPDLSGGQRVIAIYARELSRLGHDVYISCSRPGVPSVLSKLKMLLKGRGLRRATKIGRSHYENYAVHYCVVDHHRGLGPNDIPDGDVVIATFWTTAPSVAKLNAKKGKKFYLVQHDEGCTHQRYGADGTYELPLQHIYVSRWIADRIRARHPSAMGIVVNNAVDVADFDRGPRIKPAEHRFGMMWAGDTFKGGDIAVEAVERTRERGYNLKLIAFGIEEPLQQYRSMIDEFIKQPTNGEMAQIYASCTAWLFTSRFEGFGLPILEAMAARTPVIGTPTGAAPELIAHGGGVLVPMDDPTAMVDAIARFVEMDAAGWKCMSESAYRTASSSNWNEAALQFERYIRS